MPCSSAALATIVDLIGYDGANFFEGAPAATLSNMTAALRKNGGCMDTDNNFADFEALVPAPRNTSSPLHFCTGDNAPGVTATSPLANATDVSFNTNIGITFSEPVDVSTAWYTIICATSGSHTAAIIRAGCRVTTCRSRPHGRGVHGDPLKVTRHGSPMRPRISVS